MDELGLGQRGRAALHDERGELAVQIGGRSRVLVSKLVPARAVACRIARVDRWDVQVLYLERVAGDDACPRTSRGVDRGEADDVVLHDHVGLDLVEDLAQPVVHVSRAIAERTPGRLDELGELLDGGLAEDRRRLADEVLPELAGLLLDLGWRPQTHEPLLEALRLERARERLLDDEHHPVTAIA